MFLVRLFVYLLSYLEACPSLSHFGSAEAFDYRDRSSEKRGSMLILGVLCLILPGSATRARSEATASLRDSPAPSLGH